MKSLKGLLFEDEGIRADGFTHRQLIDMTRDELVKLGPRMSNDEFWELGRRWLDIHDRSSKSFRISSDAQTAIDALPEGRELSIDDMRIVEGKELGRLESMDDDGDVLGVPLGLDEGCRLDFDKHMDSIIGDQNDADERFLKEQSRERPDVELDRRYKEMPRDRIRWRRR